MPTMTTRQDVTVTSYLNDSDRLTNWTTKQDETTTLYLNGSDLTNGTSLNMSLVPEGCLIIRFDQMEYLPWDNEDNIISSEVEQAIGRAKDTIILPILFLLGAPGNVINMIVFHRQSLSERVNLCLFSLALADGVYLLQAFLMYGDQLYLQFTTKERFGPLMRFIANHNLAGFFGFSFVSQILSAVIASERCLCVLSPLKSQTMLKTKTMAVFIVLVNVIVVSVYFVVVAKYRVGCYYEPVAGVTFLNGVAGEFYQKHTTLIETLDSFVYGVGIPMVSCIVVITTTIITASKVRQAAVWRASTSSTASSNNADASNNATSSSSSVLSPRELALTKMLIGASVLFIACVSPLTLSFCWLFIPEMKMGGRHHNLFVASLWLQEAMAFANSSFNIFVYYSMGSRYRETFWAVFGRKKKNAIPAGKQQL